MTRNSRRTCARWLGFTSLLRPMRWCFRSMKSRKFRHLTIARQGMFTCPRVRTQPGLPLEKGRGQTLTHDYKRNGTTTLFAALNVLDGSVISQNMQRHQLPGSASSSDAREGHQEFLSFLNQIESQVPLGKKIHVILPFGE